MSTLSDLYQEVILDHNRRPINCRVIEPASAAQEDSRNYAGIADKGVDALIDKIVFADDRETLIAATRALDRVLLAHHYVTPTYTLRKSRIARWDRFSHPETLPEFSIGFPTVWWYDEAKAAKTGAAKN